MKWTDFHDPDFIPTFDPMFANSSLEEQARNLCNGDTACLFDVAATGRLEIGSSALSASKEQSINAALAVPSKLMCLQALVNDMHMDLIVCFSLNPVCVYVLYMCYICMLCVCVCVCVCVY